MDLENNADAEGPRDGYDPSSVSDESARRALWREALVGVIETNGRLVFASPSHQSLLGTNLEPGELLDPTRLFSHADRAVILRAMRHAIVHGSTPTVEVTLRPSQGEPRIVETGFTRLGSKRDNRLLYWVLDVTERREAEAESAALAHQVRRAAYEWQLTLDTLATPIAIVDATLKLRRLNQAALNLLDAGSFQAAIGRCLSDLHSPFWETASNAALAVFNNHLEVRQEFFDPEMSSWWDLGASLIQLSANDPPHVLIVARNTTEVRALQESLRRNELLSAMGKLIAGVAHEVRNPLFSISATLDAFQSEFGDRPEYATYLEYLRKESRRLNAVMVELLEYGRPVELQPEPLSLSAIVDRALEQARPLAERSGVRLNSIRPPGSLKIHADPGRLEGAFRNLIENAVQHSPTSSEVAVRLSVDRGARRVRCVVEDRGPGFRPQDLAHVFEPFFTRRSGGTGLGLSYVQRVVADHNGEVIASNREDGGARLTVELPITLEALSDGLA